MASTRWCHIANVVYLLVLASCVSGAKRPNIILMVADDLGYGDLGCYGNTSLRTPNIDGLAKDGVKLTHALATASMCTPSRAAMLTGRHQMRSGMAPLGRMRVNMWLALPAGLPPSEITIGELTKQAGYQNGFIGKWHMGVSKTKFGDNIHHPLSQGFDYYYGLLGTNFDDFGDDGTTVVLSSSPMFNYGLFVYWSVLAMSIWCLYYTGHVGFVFAATAIILWALPWLYFYFIFNNYLLLNSMVHRNYAVVEQPIRLVGLSKRLVQEGKEFMDRVSETEDPFLLVMSWIHTHTALRVSKEFEGRTKLGIYGDAVEELDWSVGEILGHLEKLGKRNDTLVVFVSDHGGHVELGELGGYNGIFRGGKAHGAPEGAIRVPFISRWPGVVPSGNVIYEPVSLMDVFPLIGGASGVPLPADRPIDGRDILPLLQGREKISPHEFMFHYCGNRVHAIRYRPRTGNSIWKLVSHVPRYLPGLDKCRFACGCNDAIRLPIPNLYDIHADPTERHPVDPQSDLYRDIRDIIDRATRRHQDSLENVHSQFHFVDTLWRYSLQDCCPGPFPNKCECIDNKFTPDMYT